MASAKRSTGTHFRTFSYVSLQGFLAGMRQRAAAATRGDADRWRITRDQALSRHFDQRTGVSARKPVSAAEESSRPPRHVGVYRLDAKIGSGAMGTVYRATHTTLGKEVALKIVHSGDPDGELCQRFLQEGIAASKVRHPNVVEVLDAGRDGETAYLAMQLLEGETLGECLQRQGRLPLTYAIDVILPVCAALKAAHDAGVLHRDLKPANIFLTDVGRGEPEPMLLDFGISKILGPVDAALTQNPRYLGTPLYIAPEQADGAPGSTFSDQYSLALSLYECLLGVRPFEKYASSLILLLRRVAEGEIKAPRDLDAGIPDDLDEVLCRALSRNPQDRFPSLREFGAALLPYASAPRRALWQHSFVDAERTMTSANAPISDSRNSRRVHVAVEEGARPSQLPETQRENPDGAAAEDYVSHSALFGQEGQPEDSQRFNAERSAISRRSLPATLREDERDPYSQVPSPRGLSESWTGQAQPLPTDRNSVGVPTPRSWRPKRERSPIFVWTLSAVLGLATLGTATLLVRHEMGSTPNDGSVSQSASTAQEDFTVEILTTPKAAKIELDGRLVGQGQFHAKLKRDGVLHHLKVTHPGYEAAVLTFQDDAPPAQMILKKSLEAAPAATKESAAAQPQGGASVPKQAKGSPSPRLEGTPNAQAQAAKAPASKASPPAGNSSTGETSTDSKTPATTASTEASAASKADASTSKNTAASGNTAEPKTDAAPPSSGKTKSIQTGNLNPWAQ